MMGAPPLERLLFETTHTDIGVKIGLTRTRVQQIEKSAMAKARALIAGTDDFPLLREAFGPDRLLQLIERDMAMEEARMHRQRAQNAKTRSKA